MRKEIGTSSPFKIYLNGPTEPINEFPSEPTTVAHTTTRQKGDRHFRKEIDVPYHDSISEKGHSPSDRKQIDRDPVNLESYVRGLFYPSYPRRLARQERERRETQLRLFSIDTWIPVYLDTCNISVMMCKTGGK